MSTIFLDDYVFLDTWIDYYRHKGVELFVLFYNGVSTEDIRNIRNKDVVVWIDWNLPYFNPTQTTKRHYAEPPTNGLFFELQKKCDNKYYGILGLDEFIHFGNIKDFFMKNEYDAIIFYNRDANKNDTEYLSIYDKDFSKLKIVCLSKRVIKQGYEKTFNKTETVIKAGIHLQKYKNTIRLCDSYDNFFYHFRKMRIPERKMNFLGGKVAGYDLFMTNMW